MKEALKKIRELEKKVTVLEKGEPQSESDSAKVAENSNEETEETEEVVTDIAPIETVASIETTEEPKEEAKVDKTE